MDYMMNISTHKAAHIIIYFLANKSPNEQTEMIDCPILKPCVIDRRI